jgi:hypothetical protein
MSEEITSGRVEKADVFLPFTPSLEQQYDNQPIFRLRIDVSESCSLGLLELGYYLKLNDSVYFIRKKAVSVFTNSQTERVLEYLKRTKREFTIDVRRDKTVSGHQRVEFTDVSFNSGIYTLRDFSVHRSLWQDIEYELYENLYSPSMVRFTGERLIWHAKLMPEHSLAFTQVGKITLNYVDSQGHLDVFKVEKDGDFVLPIYLFSERENLLFFNHQIQAKLDVIPLGSERRIISVSDEIKITSEDHETITLDTGQYLLFHPIPQKNKVD